MIKRDTCLHCGERIEFLNAVGDPHWTHSGNFRWCRVGYVTPEDKTIPTSTCINCGRKTTRINPPSSHGSSGKYSWHHLGIPDAIGPQLTDCKGETEATPQSKNQPTKEGNKTMSSNTTITGRLGRDPDLKFTNSGLAICRMNVGVSRRKKKNGEWEEVTVWHDVTAFGDLAENAAQSLSKGDEIIAEGYIEEPRTFEKKDGTVGVSLPFVANALGFSLRWKAIDGIPAAPKPRKATKEDWSDEPF
jgi:single stranded DNA-binding protein